MNILFSFLWDTKLLEFIDLTPHQELISVKSLERSQVVTKDLSKKRDANKLSVLILGYQPKIRQVEISAIVQALRKEGRIGLTEGNGNTIELVVPDQWDALRDKQ